MNAKKVLLVGWNPDVVDYSKWPGLSAKKLRAGLEGDRDKLNSLGYDASLALIESEDTAAGDVQHLLSKDKYDCILIGAGVRTVDTYIILFEKLINIVRQDAPSAKICFNTGPFDSVSAVQRWL